MSTPATAIGPGALRPAAGDRRCAVGGRSGRRPAVLMLLLAQLVMARDGLLSDAVVDGFQSRYGDGAMQRLLGWERLIMDRKDASETDKLALVNAFFNRIPWLSDDEHWGRRDYWATPLEMLGTHGGDCEDFSIAKYITLTKMGIAEHKLRITYVRAPRLRQPHMVLAYYAAPGAEPLILDNAEPEIRRASERRDLIPVYSFNTSGMWTGVGRSAKRLGEASKLNAWRDVSRRMQKEGIGARR